MTTLDHLAAATMLVEQPPDSVRECWPRSCAALIRIALEQGIDSYLGGAAPSLVNSPRKHQLIALPHLVDPGLARQASVVWYALSRAMHHHVYELPPTLAELRDWHATVADVMDRLRPVVQPWPGGQL